MPGKSIKITLLVSEEMLEAIDAEAFDNDQSRSATIREILCDTLRQTGSMAKNAPTTYQLGRNNPKYAMRSAR